jgi:Protein of unknown function, DUF481
MARRALPALSLALLLSIPAAARAQVNVEALRSDLEAHPLYFALQASFAGHVGNTNGAEGIGAAFAGATIGPHLMFVKGQGDYAEYSGKATIAKAFGHARYNYRFLPFLFGEAFIQVEENQFQRLALREVDGLGVRFGLVQRRDVQVYYGTAWLLDYEKLSDTEAPLGTILGPHWFAQRWGNYLAVGWKMNDRARISDAFYVQPRVNGFSDFRLLDDASFAMDIDKRFSAKVECQVHYNSAPPSSVLPLDVDTITSLVFTL